jgi:hypothetical protein
MAGEENIGGSLPEATAVPNGRRQELLNSARGGGMGNGMDFSSLPARTEVEGGRQTSQVGGGDIGANQSALQQQISKDSTEDIKSFGQQIERINSRVERGTIAQSARADREHNEERLWTNTRDAENAIREAYSSLRESSGANVETIALGAPSVNPVAADLAREEQMQLLSVQLQAAGFAPATGQSGAYEQYGYKPTEIAQQMYNKDRENPIMRS